MFESSRAKIREEMVKRLAPGSKEEPPKQEKIEDVFKASALSPFVTPFKKENLQRVWMLIYKHPNGKIDYDAKVTYISGGSEGTHAISADSLPALIEKVNVFTNGMVD